MGKGDKQQLEIRATPAVDQRRRIKVLASTAQFGGNVDEARRILCLAFAGRLQGWSEEQAASYIARQQRARLGAEASPPPANWGGGINEGRDSALGDRPAEVRECDALDDTRQDDLWKRYLVLGGPPQHILGASSCTPHPTTCHATLPI